MLQSLLFQLGIPTYMQSIFITIDGKTKINLPKQMPNQIGWIYGLSIYADGVTPENDTLVTAAQSDDMFFVFKSGQTDFIESMRLSTLNFSPANGNDLTYFELNIPSTISLDQSYIQNPTAVNNATVMLNFWYIDEQSFNILVKSGRMGVNGWTGDYQKK